MQKTLALATDNQDAWGVAYRSGSPNRLYVTDTVDNRIYIYEVATTGLTLLSSFDTTKLNSSFIAPRGIAYASETTPYFYVISSNKKSDGTFDSRLWRLNADSPNVFTTGYLNLNLFTFGINGKECHGVAFAQGKVWISYNTTTFASEADQVQKGILCLNISQSSTSWAYAKAGTSSAVIGHMPHSGRLADKGTDHESRSPSFGLAYMDQDQGGYFWGTSYHKYIYVADAATGRGVFYFDSPGEKEIYGLTFDGTYLWAIDRKSGTDQIHQLATGMLRDEAVQGPHVWRRMQAELSTTALKELPSSSTWLVRHTFAEPVENSLRPSQGIDTGTDTWASDHSADGFYSFYWPASDTSARCNYRQLSFFGEFEKNETVTSQYAIDFWTSDYRHYVYPHRCNTSGSVPSGYSADDSILFGLTHSTDFDSFLWAVDIAMNVEYGSAGLKTDPYWRARNVLEYIIEHYKYDNVTDPPKGLYKTHPAYKKVLLPITAPSGDEALTCSPAAITFCGVMHYLGIPARFVGTTKLRSWSDSNYDGFLSNGEFARDSSYHAWAEVYLGSHYGWQRFDATPFDSEPRPRSQFEIMDTVAMGVNRNDLVTTVGAGVVIPFFYMKGIDQYQHYNTCEHYADLNAWDEAHGKQIDWMNASFVSVAAPTGAGVSSSLVAGWGGGAPSIPVSSVTGSSMNVSWTLSGHWESDSTVSVKLVAFGTGETATLAEGLSAAAGVATVDLSSAPSGYCFLRVSSDQDSLTGGQCGSWIYVP